MSKAFTSEETPDQPLLVPARPPLPDGVPNFVTPRGFRLLKEELARREAERSDLLSSTLLDDERRRRLAIVAAQIGQLAARLAAAEIVDPARQRHDEVRFGATVTVVTIEGPEEGAERRFQIVGVDEAEPAQGRIAFAAPLARTLIGCRVGDSATLRSGRGDEVLEVTAIDYGSEPPVR